MGFYQGACNCQTQSRFVVVLMARLVRAVKPLEYMREIFWMNPLTVIMD